MKDGGCRSGILPAGRREEEPRGGFGRGRSRSGWRAITLSPLEPHWTGRRPVCQHRFANIDLPTSVRRILENVVRETPLGVFAALLERNLPPLAVHTALPIVLLFALVAPPPASAAPPRERFEARLADGSRVVGNQLRDWHSNDTEPQLDEQKLLTPANPFRWLVDRQRQPARTPYPAVELSSGDRLPGLVVAFRGGDERTYPVEPDSLLVRTSVDLQPPSSTTAPFVGVDLRFVRRVVWVESPQRRWEPGTAWLRDGRRVRFRAAQFNPQGVRLRTADGVRTLSFDELAEIQLPAKDPWEQYWNEIALLTADGRTRMLQLETSDGLIATASLARFRAFRRGSPTEFEKWVHGVHPAWSDQVLWAPGRTIWMRRSFAAHEPPLSRFAPSSSTSRSSLNGSPHPWRVDRNRDGRPLRSNGQQFGWGFGGHAFWQLQFPLDPRVRRFRGEFGLDYAAGSGGSVRGQVALADSEQSSPTERAESPDMIGRREPHRFDVELPGRQPGRVLQLTADPLNKSEPRGADPLDIRDAVDWLEPYLVLDEQAVRRELAERSMHLLPAWSQWTVTSPPPRWNDEANDGAKLFKLPFIFDPAWRTFWDPSIEAPGGFTRGVVAQHAPLRLSREVRLRADRPQYLVLTTYRPLHEDEEIWLQVRLNGVTLARRKAPLREGGRRDYEPWVVTLPTPTPPVDADSASASSPVTAILEIVQEPTKGSTPLVWAGAEVTAVRPRVEMLVDELLPPRLKANSGKAAPKVAEAAFAGQRSIELPAGETYHLAFDRPIPLASSNDYDSWRYLQLAYQKSGGGRFAAIIHHAGDVDRPLRYHFGPPPYLFNPAVGVVNYKLPEHWQHAMRDVVNDFGAVEATGISLAVADGGPLRIDQLCFGKHPTPLVELTRQRAPEQPLAERWGRFQQQFTNHVRAAIVHLQAPSGAGFTGALISSQGEILASPACLQSLNGEAATATLSDGRSVQAKPLGIAKPLHCGLLKIEQEGNWPHLAIAAQPDYRQGDLLVLSRAASPADRSLDPTTLAYQSDDFVWLNQLNNEADWPRAEASLGQRPGVLLDQHGAVLGFPNGDTPFGHSVRRLRTLPKQLDALRKNELTGEWTASAAPRLPIDYEFSKNGALLIARVAKGSSAAEAKLQAGDELLKIDAQTIRSISDVTAELAKHNVGDQVRIRFRRGEATRDATVTLEN